MHVEKTTADRLTAFSDAVFAVIVTVMVLELRAPDQAAFSALWPLWPTAISYAVSYLFIAIIWINHHHLMRFVGPPSLRLMWINFAHLFLVSFLPFATAWIARTRLASSPVVLYAALFVCIDIAYNVFEREVLACIGPARMSERTRQMARRRSLIVLASFTAAMLVAIVAPRVGFGLICGALLLHLRPDVSGNRTRLFFGKETPDSPKNFHFRPRIRTARSSSRQETSSGAPKTKRESQSALPFR